MGPISILRAAPDHAALNPDPTEKPQLLKASSGGIDAVATDAPPRIQSRLTHRRTVVLATLVAVILTAAIGSVLIFQWDKGKDSPSTSTSASPSIEQAQVLFATAQKFDQDGRAKDAHVTIIDAVQLYDELIKLNPDQNAPLLAPVIIQALGRAGVDFSVTEERLRTWLANPAFTPYPAISQALLLRGWRLKAPVFIDVIVWNYEHAPGITSPRNVADVRLNVLKAAILEGSNSRYGAQVADFEQLLKP